MHGGCFVSQVKDGKQLECPHTGERRERRGSCPVWAPFPGNDPGTLPVHPACSAVCQVWKDPGTLPVHSTCSAVCQVQKDPGTLPVHSMCSTVCEVWEDPGTLPVHPECSAVCHIWEDPGTLPVHSTCSAVCQACWHSCTEVRGQSVTH